MPLTTPLALLGLLFVPAVVAMYLLKLRRAEGIIPSGTADLGRVRQAVDGIRPTTEPGDLTDALELASQLAAQAGDGEVLVVTDAALASIPTTAVDGRVRVIRVGDERGRRNQAIVALAVRTAPSSLAKSVFISVANLDIEPAQRRIELWGDGNLLEARDVSIDAQQRADVIIDNVGDAAHPVGVVEVRLVARQAPTDAATPPDQLAADDRAWAIVPPDRP